MEEAGWFFPASPLPALVLTLQTGSDGIVHGPADQSHEEPQQDQEDPVFTNPGHQELMAAYRTDWEQGREEWGGGEASTKVFLPLPANPQPPKGSSNGLCPP